MCQLQPRLDDIKPITFDVLERTIPAKSKVLVMSAYETFQHKPFSDNVPRSHTPITKPSKTLIKYFNSKEPVED